MPFAQEEAGEPVARPDKAEGLTCTLASAGGLPALFFLWAEREDLSLRHYSVQSLGLFIVHILGGLIALLLGSVFSNVPLLGFVMNFFSWFAYVVWLLLTVILRLRLMKAAWNGMYHELPVIGRWLANRFV